MSDVSFNPFDPEFRKTPHPFYDRLRTEEPVHRTPLGFVVLTRYEDVVNTLRNNDFSRDIEVNANLPESPTRKFRRENERSKSMLNLDPPDHTRLRRLVSKSFTPSAIEKLRPRIQQLVDDALANAKKTGHLELVEELAFPVPFQVISDLLAMPTERGEELREWSQIITATLEPTTGVEELEKGQQAIAKMRPYLEEIIQHRRRNMGDDMLSSLIAVEEQGEKLNNDELMSFVILLYIAGHETTVNLIGNGTLALLNNPEQQAIVHNNGLAQSHIDELLRFDGPVQHTVRVPLIPVHYMVDSEQITVQPGTMVLTSLGGANHDPSMFENPNDLQLNRSNSNRHMAFASGIHYCLGASLAKLETEIAVGSLIKRFEKIEIVGTPSWRDRLTIRGVNQLRLSVS